MPLAALPIACIFDDVLCFDRLPEVPDNDLDDLPEPAKKFAAVRRAEHERILKEGKWRDAVRAYLAAISFADAMVGYVLDARPVPDEA